MTSEVEETATPPLSGELGTSHTTAIVYTAACLSLHLHPLLFSPDYIFITQLRNRKSQGLFEQKYLTSIFWSEMSLIGGMFEGKIWP